MKSMFKPVLIFSSILLVSQSISHAQSKEWESDVIYSEKQVPYYELPDPLVTIEGKRITTKEEWLLERRPQILGMFGSMIYGRVPDPESPVEVNYRMLSEDKAFFDGRCTRKHILAKFSNERGSIQMHLALFIPNEAESPVPVLLRLGFGEVNGRNIGLNNIQAYGKLGNGTPLIDFLDRGFGVACIQGGEVIPDEIAFSRSVQELYYKGNQTMPHADEWGVIAGISWQLSRAMDYLETDKAVDKTKIAILGFSKLGKSTLWAGALDTRFAMVLLQNSGAGGAALWRRRFGETMEYITRFPYWLCGNAKKYINREEDLPVDQHMLIACIAPRPIYITSGINDLWADNMGEYVSAHKATPVYELFGLKGQGTRERPRINEPANNRALSYRIRSGAHGYESTDWLEYINFMDYHFHK
jgi:hypothetical protein